MCTHDFINAYADAYASPDDRSQYFFLNIKIVDHIWNQNEKCIQISTNRPGIGSVICEMWESKHNFAQ